MRIIAGIYGGRRLPAAVPDATRPTSDRVREALGSALASRGAFEQALVLDLFSGTGALALEALSRGATAAVAVERDRKAMRCIRENAEALGVGAPSLQVVDVDLHKPAKAVAARLRSIDDRPFSLVFADPPYADAQKLPALLQALSEAGALASRALVAVEHDSDTELEVPPDFEPCSKHRYGDTSTTILARIS